MRKHFIIIFVTVLLTLTSGLQAQVITGKVVNADQEPLIGVVVKDGNNNTGVTTDADGIFRLDLGKNAQYPLQVKINYVGYDPYNLDIYEETDNVGTIVLRTSKFSLNDVVVIGYGHSSRKELTGSVATVKGNVVADATKDAPILALQGNASGVYITQGSGVPGGGNSQIVIRGYNSLGTSSSKTKPLYIIDGVPFNSNPESPIGNTSTGIFGLPDALSFINPSDIESIDILKDADATAIYGTRGANGVVLITTKKGKQGKVKVNLQLSSTAQWIGKRLDFLNTEEYVDLRRKAFETDKQYGFLTDEDLNTTNFPDLLLWDQHKDYDWQDVLLGNTAWGNEGQLSLSGGNENTQFLISGSYYKSGTVTVGDDKYKRITGHANILHTSNDKRLTLEAGFTVSNLSLDADAAGSAYSYLNTAPNTPTYDENGQVYWIPNDRDFDAPLSVTAYTGKNKVNNVISNFAGSYKILKNLAFKITLGYEYSASAQDNLYELYYYNPYDATNYNQALYYSLNTSILNIEPQLTYQTKLFGGEANILLGATYQSGDTRTLYMRGADYPGDIFLKDANSASRITYHTNPVTQSKTASLFGRVNYNYQSRYLLNVVFRRDGSSRFGPNYRYGNFYSFGGAWIFSNEQFIKNSTGSWLSHGKLRLSYGKTGNDNIADYGYITKYVSSSYPYENLVGITPNNLSNEDLQWETTKKFDVGLELGFFKDRVLFNATYYKNRSTDLLSDQALPVQTGFQSVLANQKAIIDNKGLELELNTHNIKSKDFNWTTSLNLTFPKNVLVDYPGIQSSSYYNTYKIGESINLVNGYKYIGVNPENGLPEVEDVNGDGLINSTGDYQALGTRDPKFYGGLTNTLSYKNFTFDFTFYFRKVDFQNGYLWLFYSPTGMNKNVTREMAQNYWTTPGQTAKYARLTTTSASDVYYNYYYYLSYSDAAFSDGSYLKLSNVKLSYNVPKSSLKTIGVSALQLYIQAKNLFTVTNYDSYSPETGTNTVPPTTSVTFGLNVTF